MKRLWLAALLIVGLGLLVGPWLLKAPPVAKAMDQPLCAQCHQMTDIVKGFSRSAHRDVESCNGCHTEPGVYKGAFSKARSGLKHVFAYLFEDVPPTIRLAESSKNTVNRNCIRCHGDLVPDNYEAKDRFCFDCHRFTPHGK